MKIIDFRTTIVSVPFKEPETWAFGKVEGISNVIIELKTDSGLTGLGECPMFPTARIAHEALCAMRPIVLGRDPFDREVLLYELTKVHGWHHFRRTGNIAMAGIDIALWDLVGQATGQPLYKLFGGAFRKEIPYYFYIPDKDLDLMAADAKRGVREGFNTIYVKLGGGFEHDFEVVRILREAIGPDKKLRVDANESWSEGGIATELMRRMAQYNIEFFEQPLLYYDHDGTAHLRRTLGHPVGANQSAWTEVDAFEVLRRQAADVVLTDQHQVGSLSAFYRVAWMLAMYGIPVMKHTFGELGISTAASMHVMASCPNFTKANQTHYSILTDDVIEGGIPPFHNGCLTLPESPGIGVRLDRERLKKYAKYTEEHGEFSAYGFPRDSGRPEARKGSQTRERA